MENLRGGYFGAGANGSFGNNGTNGSLGITNFGGGN